MFRQTYQESPPKGIVRARLEAQLAEAKIRLNNAQSAAGMVLLLFVFIRQALCSMLTNAAAPEKLARIRQFLGLQ